jgi:hypothetical protein
MRRLAIAAAILALSCRSEDETRHVPGDESFLSQPRSVAGAGGIIPAEGDGAAGAPSADATPREIVEADVYRLEGATLYALNAYRGLQVVDLSDPAAPRLLSRVPLGGTPVDLYLRDGVALVLASDHLSLALDEASGAAVPTYGSRLWAIDVSSPESPVVLAEIPLEGRLETSRIVGDVLLVVSRRYAYWFAPAGGAADGVAVAAPEASSDLTYVASLDVADPAGPRPVDRIDFPSEGWDTHAHVTAERVTVSQSGWGTGPVTFLQAVDASDPEGDLALGARTSVAGLVRDRWGLDFDGATGIARAVAEDGWNAGARLHVLAWPDPALEPGRLAELPIEVPESLTAARFDGDRVYVVTAARIDPLWVIDARDPSSPFVAGELEMPGQLDFIEPRGDRLLALGHTGEAGGSFQLHVSLLDVGDPAVPVLLARAIFGPDWAFVPATPDDLRKAFQVLDGQGLLLVPFQGFDPGSWAWRGGTQILTFSRDAVAVAGFLVHAGAVRRAFPLGAPGQLAALSDESLQTIDATDPFHPVELAAIDLARPVSAIAVEGDLAVELAGDYWRGAAEIVVVPADDPEAPVPLGRTPAAAPWGRLLEAGGAIWLHASDPWTGTSFVASVDVSDPSAPALGGRLDLPGASSWGWWSGEAALAGTSLAVLRTGWACGGSPLECGPTAEVAVVDLAGASAPRLAASLPLPPGAWAGGLLAAGTSIWYSQYEWVESSGLVRCWAGRIDLADPSTPALAERVNVPGWLFGVSGDGRRLYAQEWSWSYGGEAPRTLLHALALTDRGTARLAASATLPGWFGTALLSPTHAYAPGLAWDAGGARLAAVSLDGMGVESDEPVDAAWTSLARIAGGKLFLAAGTALGPAMLVYGLGDPGRPALEQAVPTSGWVEDVVVEGDVAYLPSGYHGVPRIPLSP